MAAGLTLGLAAMTPAESSAARQDPDRPSFGEIVDVQLVNVEVWVSDQQGRPVTGLSAADFEVREDGEPVTIDFFSEIAEAVPSAPADDVDGAHLAGEAPAPAPEAAPAATEPAHLVLYFDELHLGPSSRKRLIADLRTFLDEGEFPAERVLIFRQDRNLITEAHFGSSREDLDRALTRIEESPGMGGQSRAAKRLAVQSLHQLWQDAKTLTAQNPRATTAPQPCQWYMRRALTEVERYARTSRDRIAATLDHLTSTARFLAAMPGVKTVLYLSDALEQTPGKDLLDFITGLCPASDRFRSLVPAEELSAGFHQLTRHANANRVTIYALQANGLRASFLSTAEQGSVDFLGGNPFNASNREAERDGLALLADETGGRAIFNRNRFGGELERIAGEMASYYSLAYRPPHGGDGAEHQIRVRVPGRRDARVRHRRGYRDKSSDQRMSEQLDGALYLGLVDNPLGVRLGAGRLRAAGGGKRRLPLHVLVPAARVAFLPTEDKRMAQIRVQVRSRHARTSKVAEDEKTFLVEMPPDRETRTLDLLFHLEIPDGVNLVAVGVRDDATRETAFVSTTLAVGEGGRNGP